jgi:hypothetical protein
MPNNTAVPSRPPVRQPSCCSRNAHGQKGRCGHETADQSPRPAAEQAQDAKRQPAMQVPALHRQRHQKPADEQEDHIVGVVRTHLPAALDAQRRKEHQRHECRHRQRQRLGDPPDRHQRRDGRRARGHRIARLQIDELHDCQKAHDPTGQPEPAHLFGGRSGDGSG